MNSQSPKFSSIGTVAILFLLPARVVGSAELPAELRKHETGRFAVLGGGQLPTTASEPFTLLLENESHSFVVDLAPKGTPARKARYVGADGVREEQLESKLFVGSIRGDSSSYARVVLVGDSLVAVILRGSGEEIWAEPMRRYDPNASPQTLLTYHRTDVESSSREESAECEHVAHDSDENRPHGLAMAGERADFDRPPGRFLADGEVLALKIAVVGEFEYTEEFPTEQDAVDDLNSVVELATDIFMPDLGVSVQADVEVITDPLDPYFPIVSTTTSSQIFSMLSAYRIAQDHAATGYGTTHLRKNSVSASNFAGNTNAQISMQPVVLGGGCASENRCFHELSSWHTNSATIAEHHTTTTPQHAPAPSSRPAVPGPISI